MRERVATKIELACLLLTTTIYCRCINLDCRKSETGEQEETDCKFLKSNNRNNGQGLLQMRERVATKIELACLLLTTTIYCRCINLDCRKPETGEQEGTDCSAGLPCAWSTVQLIWCCSKIAHQFSYVSMYV